MTGSSELTGLEVRTGGQLGCVNMQLYNPHPHPFFSQPCIVEDCGELKPGEHDGVTGDDGTGDVYAEWPVDSEVDFSKVNNSIYNINLLFLV